MLGATLLVVLSSVIIPDTIAEPFLVQITKALPPDLQYKATQVIIGLSGAKAYITSGKEDSVENVVDEMFSTLQRTIPKIRAAPTGHMRFPHYLGYLCWSHGKVQGLNTVQQIGKVKVEKDDGVTYVDIKFHFTNLHLEFDKCGYKKGLVWKSVKCKVDVGDHEFKVRLALFDFNSVINIVTSLVKQDCVVVLIDIEMTYLKDLGMDIIKRDGTKGSFSDDVLENFLNNNVEYIRCMITERARIFLNDSLSKNDGFFCKAPSLDKLVQNKYQSYFGYARSNTMKTLFEQLCGDGDSEPSKASLSNIKDNQSGEDPDDKSSEDIGEKIGEPVRRPGT